VAASKTNETLCENSMVILKLLSEEVFDFSAGELTQVCIDALISALHGPGI
jgi:exportin-1